MDRSKLPLCTVLIGLMLLFATTCRIAHGEDVVLSKRYAAPLEGFSLRPPAGTGRVKQPSPSLLVSWSKRDAKSGAIAWTLSVQRAIESKTDIELGPYSNALAEKLRNQENFRIDSLNILPVAGKGAIHLVGQTGGIIQSWQRQVWILTEPGRFLIISITGPVGLKDQLNAICEAVLGTVELNDPQAALAARKENIARGEEFLAALTTKKLQAAICNEPLWYLFNMNGKYVGFMKVTESVEDRSNARGLAVVQHVMMQLPDDKLRLLKREEFATADRSVEFWKEWSQIGEGPGAQWMREEGLKQAKLVVCSISGPTGERTNKKPVPVGIYLPRALGKLLGRLVNLSVPSVHAFAIYNTAANSFDMRTFSVIGPDKIALGDRQVDCVQVTDQLAADTESVQLWLDARGVLLRMQSPQGLTMEKASYPKILRRFYAAESYIERLDEQARRR